MQTSALLLIASIGAISVLLMLYIYIFTFERRLFLVLWFVGWAIIALNYSLDAFSPGLLRQSRPILFLSLCSYFYANLSISWSTITFLKIKTKMSVFISIGIIWLVFFIMIAAWKSSPLLMIQYASSSVYTLFFLVGIVMVRSAKKYGGLVLLLGFLNIAWVCNTVIFSYIINCTPLTSPFDVTLIKSEDNICVVQPDIIVICDNDKIDKEGRYKGVPTLAVEVLSDSTRSKDMLKKLDLYKQCGIREYWLADPKHKLVHVYVLDKNEITDGMVFQKGSHEYAESAHFNGLKLSLANMFL